MLKKENRLLSKFEFNITRKHGQHLQGELVHIFVLKPRNYEGPTKIGFVVSNKFHKKAVKRNKIKRKFREVARELLQKHKDDLWIVIQPKFKSMETSYEEISTDFSKVLQKISISS